MTTDKYSKDVHVLATSEPTDKNCDGISRRSLLKSGAVAAGMTALGFPYINAKSSNDELHVASMFDLTGNLNIYGQQQMRVSRYAIDMINKEGGVLGRKVRLHEFDTQSRIEQYSRYAQEIGLDPDISAVVGCFTGASREAARPVLSRYGKLLFFPTIDEGGSCDRYTFLTGTDCLQQQKPLIEWASESVGKTMYIAAADYVYGHVATVWTKHLAEQYGIEVVGDEFVPLEVDNFDSTIRRIQETEPAIIMSHLVGNNHIAFYRQIAAAGMKDRVQIISPVFGLGNEQRILSAEEGEGIVVAYSYFDTLETDENKRFIEGYKERHEDYQVMADTPVQGWNAWYQWKIAVENAGTTELMPLVKALEDGAEYVGPSGRVEFHAPSHRDVQDVHLARVSSNQEWEVFEGFEQVMPTQEHPPGGETCDLTGKDKNSHRMIRPDL